MINYPVQITIDNSDLTSFIGEVEKYSARVQAGVQKEVTRTTYAVEMAAKINAPVKYGRLRSSIKARMLSGGLTGQIDVKVNYAAAVHEGSKPHAIPVGAKGFLAWRLVVGSQRGTGKALYRNAKGVVTTARSKSTYIFTRKPVMHPGTKPNPFLKKAVDAEQSTYVNNLLKVLNESAK